jgi:hypothetical protein
MPHARHKSHQGTLKWPSGDEYVGEFKRGLRNGYGKYTQSLSGVEYNVSNVMMIDSKAYYIAYRLSLNHLKGVSDVGT